jgi:transcription termination factor NusB
MKLCVLRVATVEAMERSDVATAVVMGECVASVG